VDGRSRSARDLDAASADVDDDRGLSRQVDTVQRGLMNEPRLLGPRDDPRTDAGLLRDGAQEFSAVLGFARGAGRDGNHFVDAVRLSQAAELRKHLERRVHRFGRQGAPIQAAGAEAHHLLLPVDHIERVVGPYLHYYHMDRVGPDVDGSYAHAPTIM